jgi:hypothetical protein
VVTKYPDLAQAHYLLGWNLKRLNKQDDARAA